MLSYRLFGINAWFMFIGFCTRKINLMVHTTPICGAFKYGKGGGATIISFMIIITCVFALDRTANRLCGLTVVATIFVSNAFLLINKSFCEAFTYFGINNISQSLLWLCVALHTHTHTHAVHARIFYFITLWLLFKFTLNL